MRKQAWRLKVICLRSLKSYPKAPFKIKPLMKDKSFCFLSETKQSKTVQAPPVPLSWVGLAPKKLLKGLQKKVFSFLSKSEGGKINFESERKKISLHIKKKKSSLESIMIA